MKQYDPSAVTQQKLEKAFQVNPMSDDQKQRVEAVGTRLHQTGRYLTTIMPECPELDEAVQLLRRINLLVADAIRKHEA